MTIPNDIARCSGTARQECNNCERRQGWGTDKPHMTPPINLMTGYCPSVIPVVITVSDRT